VLMTLVYVASTLSLLMQQRTVPIPQILVSLHHPQHPLKWWVLLLFVISQMSLLVPLVFIPLAPARPSVVLFAGSIFDNTKWFAS
jgi:hypothetical protein